MVFFFHVIILAQASVPLNGAALQSSGITKIGHLRQSPGHQLGRGWKINRCHCSCIIVLPTRQELQFGTASMNRSCPRHLAALLLLCLGCKARYCSSGQEVSKKEGGNHTSIPGVRRNINGCRQK